MSPAIRHDAVSTALEIRALASLAEYRACVALQAAIWGTAFESVPASMLQISTYVGGICLGAFTPHGDLCGFVYGLTGYLDGRPLHWSHLLGVRESARNLGVGRLLKAHQCALLAAQGISEMRWTFDPLIARNAHLNLDVLGARVVRYAPNMYGITDSPLHHGLATDRLVVALDTTSTPRVATAAFSSAPMLTLEPQPGDELLDRAGVRPTALHIEVPADFQLLVAQSPERAAAWQNALREHCLWALDNGYTVTGLHRDPATSRAFYALDAR